MADIRVYERGHDSKIVVEVDGVPHTFDTPEDALAFRRSVERSGVVDEFEQAGRALLKEFEDVVDGIARPQRLFLAGGVKVLAEQAEAGAFVGNSGLTKEQILAWAELFAAFGVFLNTPLPGAKKSPAQVMTEGAR